MDKAMMLVTYGDHVLWDIEGSPWGVDPMMHFCRSLLASMIFTTSFCAFHNRGPYGSEPGMGQIFSVGSIGSIS